MISTRQVLDVWDRGAGGSSETQTQLLLSLNQSGASAEFGIAAEELNSLTVGERNHRLLELHRSLFGPQLEAHVECTQCDQMLDLVFSVDQFGFDGIRDLPDKRVIECGAVKATARLPNGHDLVALSGMQTAEEGRSLLFSRCFSNLSKDGINADIAQLDEFELRSLETLLSELDPRIELLFNLSCPACANQWQAPLELDYYLWQEFDLYARELLENIHLLAKSYGWSESEILAMSDKRRRYYVDRVLQ